MSVLLRRESLEIAKGRAVALRGAMAAYSMCWPYPCRVYGFCAVRAFVDVVLRDRDLAATVRFWGHIDTADISAAALRLVVSPL